MKKIVSRRISTRLSRCQKVDSGADSLQSSIWALAEAHCVFHRHMREGLGSIFRNTRCQCHTSNRGGCRTGETLHPRSVFMPERRHFAPTSAAMPGRIVVPPKLPMIVISMAVVFPSASVETSSKLTPTPESDDVTSKVGPGKPKMPQRGRESFSSASVISIESFSHTRKSELCHHRRKNN